MAGDKARPGARTLVRGLALAMALGWTVLPASAALGHDGGHGWSHGGHGWSHGGHGWSHGGHRWGADGRCRPAKRTCAQGGHRREAARFGPGATGFARSVAAPVAEPASVPAAPDGSPRLPRAGAGPGLADAGPPAERTGPGTGSATAPSPASPAGGAPPDPDPRPGEVPTVAVAVPRAYPVPRWPLVAPLLAFAVIALLVVAGFAARTRLARVD